MPPTPFLVLFALAWSWMALVVAASVVSRRRAGKPVWATDDPDALFVEKRASGASHRTWWTRLGGAQNTLAVVVTPTHIGIRVQFPFNLMFLPEIYGLEHSVPLDAVRDVERVTRFGRDGVRLVFEGDVAPTVLALMGLPQPAAMTGTPLVDVTR